MCAVMQAGLQVCVYLSTYVTHARKDIDEHPHLKLACIPKFVCACPAMISAFTLKGTKPIYMHARMVMTVYNTYAHKYIRSAHILFTTA
jgi:hypothetical protein